MGGKTSSQVFPPSLIWLLAGLSFGWGLNWPIIKLVVSEMEPMHFRALCLLFGAASLMIIARLKHFPLQVPRGQWARIVATAFVNVTCWNILTVYGIRLMASGRASILAYTMPVWGVFLSAWLLREPFTKRRVLGVALGMTGMGLLMGSEIAAVGRSFLGFMLMIGAALTWAFGTVMIKRWPVDLPPSVFAGWQMAIGVIPILVAALVQEKGGFNPFILSRGPFLGVIYTLLVSYVYCYWAWMKIALIAPVGVSSLGVMMIPVIGVFSGMLILGETPHWQDYVALIAVVGSLATVMLPQRRSQTHL